MNTVRLLTFIAISLFLTKTITLSAQSNLRNDSVFFNSRIETLNQWLNSTGVGQVFYLDSIIIDESKLEVSLLGKYQDTDSLKTAWNTLVFNYDENDVNALYQKIFNFFAFEFEISKDSLILQYKLNPKDIVAEVFYNKKKGVIVKQKNFYKNGTKTRNFNTMYIELENLNLSDGPVIEYEASSNSVNLKTTRNKINEYLTEYYSKKGTFWYDAKVEILKETYNELTFEVTQLSEEILTDRNYFEYIRIEFKLVKNDTNFDVKIDVMGKYCGGFGFAPRRSEYRNMETNFKDYLQRYEAKLAIKIKKLLTD